jgi:hypothetical protein
MRDGGFRCRECLDAKLHQEAKDQGCKLLGPGRNRAHRLYELDCRHKQVVATSSMRTGEFACNDCLEEKLNEEAEARDCKIVGGGRNKSYRLYRLPCRHKQEVTTGNMRKGVFRCIRCLAEQLNQEAEDQECKLLGPGRNAHHRLYELPCKHKQEVQPSAMRVGRWECKDCIDERLRQEAEDRGCTLLGPGKSVQYRLYELDCGDKQQMLTSQMRRGGFECKTCVAEKHRKEAEAWDCKLLGPGRDKRYRLYELSCGHPQQVDVGRMREGGFECQICEETSRTLPSNVYLLHIKVDSDEWLKLGYAKSVKHRATRYGLPPAAEVTTVYSIPFDTGNEAHAVEADIHKRYKRKRLTKKQMAAFHAKDGFNECYPVIMLETLLAELEGLKAQAG